MNEMNIITNLESPQEKGKEIKISIENEVKKNLYYKFLIGNDGTWETIKDFSLDNYVFWKPEFDGRYIILVQAKKEGSEKAFDYTSRTDFIIGKCEETLIKSLNVDKNSMKIGDKVTVRVESNSSSLLYRYWIKTDTKWTLIKDYSVEDNLIYTPKAEGEMEFLVECKKIYSSNLFDDFKSIKVNVLPISKLEITNLKCLSSEILANEELTFEVDDTHDESRIILYKFVKLDENCESTCIQDYSTKKLVTFKENIAGNYKILCLAKDMYSPNEYDDRAVIHYKVYPYKQVELLSFTSNVSSPQVVNTDITLKAVASGGNDLLYKFIIDGNECFATKFTREDYYVWSPTKAGDYKIYVYVKDKTFQEDYEAKEVLEFTIEEDFVDKVNIEEVIFDKKRQILINEPINLKIIATGGTELKYSFVVKKNGSIVEKVEYSDDNSAYFVPEEVGKFQIDVRVKDVRSKREYDAHSIYYLDCYEYIPAKIEYILTPNEEFYLIGNPIFLEVICENTEDILMKYVIKIEGHEVERSGYIEEKKFKFTPRCGGKYIVDIMVKNSASTKEYDHKKTLVFNVFEAKPVTSCKITTDKKEFKCNEGINFHVTSEGGKDVIYEFYLMEKGEWSLIQRYSKKDYYTFIPFKKGVYKLLALAKSTNKKIAYEDYDLLEIKVNL